MIRLLFGLLLIHLGNGQWNHTLRIVPRFTSLPPPVSYFTETAQIDPVGSDRLDLVCRAWPPNARVALVSSSSSDCAPSPGAATATTTCVTDGYGTTLVPLPQGLGQQRFGFLVASQHPSRSLTGAWLDSIAHGSLADAIREYPAAAPNDEVVVRFSVTSVAEVRQLESVRLHCLISTAFGQVLSPPFRVAVASLGEFPGHRVDDTSDGPTHTVEYLTNNIAAVECRLPAHSQPRPLVSFELNDTLISDASLQSDKYRVVWRPDGQSVSLLIHGVQFTDWGTYRCFITNPLTGEKKYSPESTLIKLNSPKNPVKARIMVPLASSGDSIGLATAPGSSTDRSQKIEVDEGQNVTLFCIIQGAPPPSVMTTAFAPNATDHNRFQTDRKFGLLQITNVQPRDSGFYVCSNRIVGSNALLHVKPRLRLTVQPENVLVPRLGTAAQFKCSTSNQSVAPQWLFNGQPLPLFKATSLDLANVTASQLGVYQCVAGFSMGSPRPSSDTEWVSSSAVLALQSDRVIQTAAELSEFLPHSLTGAADSTIAEVTTSELTPEAQLLYDNLAASVLWQPLRLDQSSPRDNQAVEYRLEYSVETSPSDEPPPASDSTPSAHNPDTLAALVGLVGHAAIRWSDPAPLKQQTTMTVSYVTEAVLKPSRRYRFRVVPIDPSTGVNLAPPSGWSNVISTEHISPVEPPQIKMVRPLAHGRVHLVWTFDGAFRPINHLLHSTNARPPSALVQSSSARPTMLEPDTGLFVPDYFLILARPLVKPRADATETFKYGAYWSTQVNGSMAREGILSGLNRSLSYQVVVYAARGTADRRQITRFSKAAYVNLAASDHSGAFSLWRALTTNRLMYLILGGIAACMFLVVFVFILLCLCRQRNERRVTGQRKKQNGFVQGYKDTSQYIPVSTMERQTAGSHQSGAGTISNQRATSSTPMMMMMNNLQCSAFSDHSAQQQQQQQQHTQSTTTTTNPMHPNDPYSAAMMNEMMLMQQQQQQQQQQHHQSLMGSQMHLPQEQLHRQHHHQSHHSLLLPPGTMFSPVAGQTGYQSGTLPGGGGAGAAGGPRYVRQQQQQYGSQQPLNRSMTPAANMMDAPNEFYQTNVYAHHQPQLPPVPMHPQNADLHGMSAGNPMHPTHQMVYYSGGAAGPMTPNNGSSVNREPPTGGPPLPDGSAYGTLLQRGQLTGSMIADRSSMGGGSMRPVSSHHPGLTYYHPHGSQQALHMMQHTNGMSTPQPALYSTRQPQQQQQQVFFTQPQHPQYPGYFVQSMPQHPDAVGHGPHGYGHTDGESIYSYFSQQDVGHPHHHQPQQQQQQQPGSHQPLNPLPEENQMHPGGGYVESGMQTNNADSQGAGLDGSPAAAGGSHRHHRRRRRKQPRQLSDTANGGANSGSGDLVDSGPPMSEQPGDAQLEDQRPMFENEYGGGGQKRAHSTPRPGGNYSDSDPLSGHQGFASPQNGQAMNESSRSAYTRYDSPPRGQMPGGQLPPPNQPPPPPPPPGMANGFAQNDHHNHHHPFSTGYAGQNGDSLSRRFYAGGPAAVVGPPPRMRDYSEYGIPRGIGLPPPAQSTGQHNAGAAMLGMSPTPPGSNGAPMLYTGRYREGQA